MLELDGLTRRFGDVVALDGLTFAVEPGQLFGFVGRNGAGKTTAMRIVLGVLAPDAGEVRWEGRPIDASARRRIGYMPEERGLYPKMSARRQLVYFGMLHGLSEQEARRSAEALARWADPVDGITVLAAADGRVELELAPGTDEQRLLDAARRAGRVKQFVRVEPRLVDVFRDVVQE